MSETPEQLARQQIDALLVAAGWVVQDYIIPVNFLLLPVLIFETVRMNA